MKETTNYYLKKNSFMSIHMKSPPRVTEHTIKWWKAHSTNCIYHAQVSTIQQTMVSAISQMPKGTDKIMYTAENRHYILLSTVELTTEFTLIIRLGEPLIRDGKSNIESNAGARWFTCMCSSYPSFENFCGSKYNKAKASVIDTLIL